MSIEEEILKNILKKFRKKKKFENIFLKNLSQPSLIKISKSKALDTEKKCIKSTCIGAVLHA